VTEFSPAAVEASEQHAQEMILIDKMAETIIQDENGYYIVDLKKVDEYNLQNRMADLEQVARVTNAEIENESKTGVNTFFFGLTLAQVMSALTLAFLGWLVTQILEVGLYLACQWQGYNMYLHSIAGRYNPGSYYFYSLCRARGFM
jgi:hypothetical protein